MLAFIMAVWYFGVMLFAVPDYLVPSPQSVWNVFANHSSLLARETLITFNELMGGFFLAVSTAMPLALLMSYSRGFERLISPLIVITQAIPKVALAPLLLVWFGFGIFPKIL